MPTAPDPTSDPQRGDDLSDRVGGAIDDAVRAVKPHLRGWLHAGTFPLAVAAGIVLIVLADGTRATAATAIYATSAALLFGVSAIYHRGHWSPRVEKLLKRLDHSNIFLIIAGTYTPFSLLLLDDDKGRTLLWLVWAGALAGIAFRVFWVGAPRWLYTPVYIALGWVAVFYLKDILRDRRSRCRRAAGASAGCSTASAVSSTPSSGRTRHRDGSASTRSSTR